MQVSVRVCHMCAVHRNVNMNGEIVAVVAVVAVVVVVVVKDIVLIFKFYLLMTSRR